MEHIILLIVFIVSIILLIFESVKENKREKLEWKERELKLEHSKEFIKEQDEYNKKMIKEGYVFSCDDSKLKEQTYDEEIKNFDLFSSNVKLDKYNPSKELNVLIGDYDIVSISNSINILESMGIKTHAVRSGTEIIDRIESGEKYDIIITNNIYKGGNCDGREVLNTLKRIDGFNTPVVVLTVSSGKKHLFVDEYGFDEYLTKVLTQKQILDVFPKIMNNIEFKKIKQKQ